MIKELLNKPLAKLALAMIFLFVFIAAAVVLSDEDIDSTVDRLIFGSAWTAALFSFLLFGAIGGSLALLASFIPKGMDKPAAKRWQTSRVMGRAGYIRNAVVFIGVPTVAMICLVFLSNDQGIQIPYSEYVRNLVVLCIVIIGLTIFASAFLWKAFENQFKTFENEDETDKSSEQGSKAHGEITRL